LANWPMSPDFKITTGTIELVDIALYKIINSGR
jgi:hypothetical protein